MSLLIAMIVGAIVGGLAGTFLFKDRDNAFMHTILGLVGGVLGAAVQFLFLRTSEDIPIINAPGLVCAIIGALVLVMIFSAISHIKPKQVAHAGTDENTPEEVEEDD